MNVKDRRILLFLQIFFFIVGLYQLIKVIGLLQSGQFSGNLFEFRNGQLPVISLLAAVVAGFASLISSFSLWARAVWSYGFCLITSGLLFCYHLLSLGEAIRQNSYEIIPIILVLIVILQSFPFLLKRSYRSM